MEAQLQCDPAAAREKINKSSLGAYLRYLEKLAGCEDAGEMLRVYERKKSVRTCS